MLNRINPPNVKFVSEGGLQPSPSQKHKTSKWILDEGNNSQGICQKNQELTIILKPIERVLNPLNQSYLPVGQYSVVLKGSTTIERSICYHQQTFLVAEIIRGEFKGKLCAMVDSMGPKNVDLLGDLCIYNCFIASQKENIDALVGQYGIATIDRQGRVIFEAAQVEVGQ